jgi:hypothetical protein
MLRCRRSKREGGQGRAKLARRGSLDGPVSAGDTIGQEPRQGFLPACPPGVARTPGGIIESKGAGFPVGGVDLEFSQQSRQEAGGQSEGLGAGHSSVARGHMLRSGRSRLGSSTYPARHEGSHADNELAAGHADGAQLVSARQRISPSRRP